MEARPVRLVQALVGLCAALAGCQPRADAGGPLLTPPSGGDTAQVADSGPPEDTAPPADSDSGVGDDCVSEIQCEGELCWSFICGGAYAMGSAEDVGDKDELPRHEVTLGHFELLVSEVTVGQYRPCVEAGICRELSESKHIGDGHLCNWGRKGRDDHPMSCVDWTMAQVFCKWLGARLPSEAQWEFAARSRGQDRLYPWGDEEPSCKYAVLHDDGDYCGGDPTQPVCQLPAGNTEQGLCDMAGNVFEWVQDWYHSSYEGAPADGSAWEDPVGNYRVMRGGGVGSAADYRAANRTFHAPDFAYPGLGFRCAR